MSRQIDIMETRDTDCEVCGGYGSGRFGEPCMTCIVADHAYMSFGGGVQSTAIAELVIRRDPRLLAAVNQLPELFIFADTGDEPEAVYAHVEVMKARIEAAGFMFKTVCKGGRLGDTALAGRVDIPAWVDTDTTRMPMRRACTVDWKASVLDREAKAHYGINLRTKRALPMLSQWYGISTDEAQRTKISQDKWRVFTYPLISMRWTRDHCTDYLASIGINAPKSACVFCPFHGDEVWRSLSPADMARAIEVEDAMTAHRLAGTGYPAKLNSAPTLHRSGIPLRERPFDQGQEGDMIDNECAGICGV
jgi:hypothetical protein